MLGVVSAMAHLVPGFFMVVSGLVAPLWAVALMVVVWFVLTGLLVAMVIRRSWWTPVVPVVAVAFWVAVLTLGERMLGWTA